MGGDIIEDAGECADSQCIVLRDGDVMLRGNFDGETDMTSRLSRDAIAQAAEATREVAA
jgi:hypothetical protein